MSVTFDENFNLADYYLFARLREGRGGRTAIRFGERTYTYAQVADKALRAAVLCLRAQVHPGERVYLVLPDTPPFAWAFFGALAAGGVVALGNPLAPPEDLAGVVRYIDARVIITTPEVAQSLRHVTSGRTVYTVEDRGTFEDPEADTGPNAFAAALAAVDVSPALPELHRDAPAIWLFTSGSTGRPKAAMHCHRDFAFNTEVYAKRTIGYREDDVCVSVPRLFFGYATGTNLMFPFAVGACAALFSERPTAEQIAWAVKYYRATALTNVPTLMARLLEAQAEGADLDLSSLRFSLSAGEALPPPLLERWTARIGVPVYDGIGSAEMFHIYVSNRPGDIKAGSLGRVVEGYTARILPAEADGPGAVPCATGETGVLWIKGDSVAQGYWLDRDKSFATFHGHWCRTGDLFRVDEGGYFWFAGRADQLLKVGGQFVSPLEVEGCLALHPAVVETAVIGVERDGLTLTRAYVEAREPGTPELGAQLQTWVRERLARYKYPREVVFVDALPRNDRGKVDKAALLRLATQGET